VLLTLGRINLLLGALVLVLGALLMFGPDQDQGAVPLIRLEPDQIQRINRSGPGANALTLERHAHGWRMLSPYQGPADPSRVRGLLAIASQPSRARFPASAEELPGFGLAPPAILLELDTELLGFGRTDPVYFRRYVLHRNQVHLIDDQSYRHLIAAAETFVSRRLVEPGKEILAIIGPGSELRWNAGDRRQTEGTSTPPPQALIRAWQEAEALEVRKATAAAGGTTIEVWIEGGESPLPFLMAPEQPDLLIRPDLGLSYRLPADAALLRILRVATESAPTALIGSQSPGANGRNQGLPP